MVLQVEIPDTALENSSLGIKDLLIDFAVFLYQTQRLSIGRASKIANLDVISFQKEMMSRNVYVHYDEKDFEKDMRIIEKLNL